MTVESAHPVLGLSDDELTFYHREGYVILRDLFSKAEVDVLASDVARLIAERSDTFHSKNMRVRFKPNVNASQPVVEVIDPISDLSNIAKAICLDKRLTDKVASICGEACCLFKDKYFCKPAGTDGVPLHQDWIGWPTFPESFLTVLLAVDPFNPSTGATQVYPRMHSNGYLSPKDGMHHLLKHESMTTAATCLTLEPGDVAIFSCFTPHYSDPNSSNGNRRGYFISYNAASEGGEQWASHYSEFHQWIRSRYPEDLRGELEFV